MFVFVRSFCHAASLFFVVFIQILIICFLNFQNWKLPFNQNPINGELNRFCIFLGPVSSSFVNHAPILSRNPDAVHVMYDTGLRVFRSHLTRPGNLLMTKPWWEAERVSFILPWLFDGGCTASTPCCASSSRPFHIQFIFWTNFAYLSHDKLNI
jgi:hypothetical protein